jgi:hypothetical protein
MDAQKAAATVSLFGAATVSGRIGNGYMADRFFAPHAPAAVFGAATGIALLWQGAIGNLVYFASFIIGLALGAEADLMPFLVSRYFGMRAMGSLLGCIFTPTPLIPSRGLFSCTSQLRFSGARAGGTLNTVSWAISIRAHSCRTGGGRCSPLAARRV